MIVLMFKLVDRSVESVKSKIMENVIGKTWNSFFQHFFSAFQIHEANQLPRSLSSFLPRADVLLPRYKGHILIRVISNYNQNNEDLTLNISLAPPILRRFAGHRHRFRHRILESLPHLSREEPGHRLKFTLRQKEQQWSIYHST